LKAPGVEVKTRLGENLRRCRKQADLSQEELSFRAGLHRTAVSQLERGIRAARADTLVRLAGALEIPAASLLDGLTWTPGSYEAGRFALSGTQEEAR
jgi:transcriptional regulator with XRE-family HTH domain